MIRETIVTTQAPVGSVHIAPIGLIVEPGGFVIAPFRPSQTLENLRANPHAVANYTDDVLIFAGCLTGRRDWPTRPAAKIPGAHLAAALAHAELAVERVEEHPERPRFHCASCMRRPMRPFAASTGPRLPSSRPRSWSAGCICCRRKDRARDRLSTIAIDKTAGPNERQAWDWLMERIATFRRE
jgi:hypothetical protein